MFEDIGVLIGIAMFFALSLALGWIYGLGARLILRSQERHRKLWKIAAAFPPIFAVYMLACAIVFSLIVPGDADRIFSATSMSPCRMATPYEPWRKCQLPDGLRPIRRRF